MTSRNDAGSASFRSDSAVRKAGDEYHGLVHADWGISGNANGGYLMAIAARAMANISRPHPVSLTAHFLSPCKAGPVSVRPQIVKQGRRFTTVRAQLVSDGRPVVELLGSFSDLSEVEGPVLIDAQPPELPPPGDCVRVAPSPSGFPPPMMSKIDLRLHPDDDAFARGRPSGRPLFRGWFRLPGEDVDALALLLAADAFPPTVFNAHLPIAWTPTLELTAHLRGIPRPGWLRCRFSTRFITGGMLEEDGDIWDESGRLVAQSRQLALQPRADPRGE